MGIALCTCTSCARGDSPNVIDDEITIESQSLNLSSVKNARELGGYITNDGRVVKKGILLRSGNLSGISSEDIHSLIENYRLSVIIDFRSDSEILNAPDPDIAGVKYVNYHIIDDESIPKELINEKTELRKQGIEIDKAMELELLVKYGVLSDKVFIDFLSSELGKKGYGQFFHELIVLPDDQSVIFHCSQGKDRTGLGAMLLLFSLGVKRDVIIDDFLLTNEFNAKLIEEERQYLMNCGVEGNQLDLYMAGMDQVNVAYINNAIEWMDKNYGSPVGYIVTELGVTNNDIETLQNKFLERSKEKTQ